MEGLWIIFLVGIITVAILVFITTKMTEASVALQEKRYSEASNSTVIVSLFTSLLLAIAIIVLVLTSYYNMVPAQPQQVGLAKFGLGIK
jgi:uncharacterized BrkB/YihY/UPF0761 family membrane protein